MILVSGLLVRDFLAPEDLRARTPLHFYWVCSEKEMVLERRMCREEHWVEEWYGMGGQVVWAEF